MSFLHMSLELAKTFESLLTFITLKDIVVYPAVVKVQAYPIRKRLITMLALKSVGPAVLGPDMVMQKVGKVKIIGTMWALVNLLSLMGPLDMEI